ncbi:MULTISPECIES: SDR family NAD(P)-dependent oxidoreductase [Sphingobium]|uniref:SDR family NAD(P)-dependent oxidoreductase n=1 Tax=Sphingobium sp. MI1205 TaxID=407020 RepID=UPI000770268A|nr:SDR family oxidoreductase [Sphingobium sp. MI1205]AMK19597.1 short-chain dehydrogenase/reductase SDR [Sphingobium sp. MI1205]
MNGKVGIVTGAAKGIGRAVALQLLRDGATVYAFDRDASALQKLTEESGSHPIVSVLGDVDDDQAATELVARCLQETGKVDFLVNVAGIVHPPQPLHELSAADFDRTIAVNLKGYFLFYRAAAEAMIAAGKGGAIVNIASTAGIRPVPRAGAYAASKHGVIGLTTTAALEVAAEGIRVNAICPGVTDTPMLASNAAGGPATGMIDAIPFRRLGQPDDIAAAVAWLISDQASYITGVALPVDGGLSLV